HTHTDIYSLSLHDAIPALVEYLNPKSFNLSSILEVSLILKRLNTSAMISPRIPFLNGEISSRSAIFAFTSQPFGRKYFFGVSISKLLFVGSLIYGNVFGKI